MFTARHLGTVINCYDWLAGSESSLPIPTTAFSHHGSFTSFLTERVLRSPRGKCACFSVKTSLGPSAQTSATVTRFFSCNVPNSRIQHRLSEPLSYAQLTVAISVI
jgi:hypothetical protein